MVDTNVLYYGDNLDILRKYIPSDSVDLVYLDPPFNSNQSYSAIFADESGRKSDAQIQAFDDSWHWGPTAEGHLSYLKNSALHQGKVPVGVSQFMAALEFGIGKTPMLAYLVEMSVRLVELHRVLTPVGSLWLHCDPTASHYLKLILDAIFGKRSFRNEVIWHFDYGARSKRTFGTKHDVLFWYSKSGSEWTFNAEAVLEPFASKMTEWRYTKGGQAGKPMPAGKVPSDVWAIKLNAMSKERLGYPTQKPLELLERIVAACSNPGDVVLDPFCGCGTALVAAQKLSRRWVGIDVTYLAIAVMRRRLHDSFPDVGGIPVIGQPTEVQGARLMATDSPEGRYQFQWWALDLVGALPASGDQKKGSDLGIDGRITFTGADGSLQQAIVSVKSGKPKADDVRVLKAVCEREAAAIGLLVTLEEPTKPMTHEATIAGVYHSDVSDKDYPRIQILSVADILERGKRPILPPLVSAPYQRAARVVKGVDQQSLFGSVER